MPEQQGDKSHQATPHRRQRAREEGHVAKSQDLGSAVLLLAGMLALLMSGRALLEFLGEYTTRQLGGRPWLTANLDTVTAEWNSTLFSLAKCLLPILGLMMLTAIAINLVQVGFLFLPAKLSPDISRLSLTKGFGRLFSLANAARLGFGLFKILVIASVAFVSLYGERETILGLTALPATAIGAYLLEILLWTTIKVGLALLLLALLDYAFQRWRHEEDLKMTPQEVREEMRNLEGDPQIVARRRVVQRQLALSRLSTAVPKADVVITNPTELAVAIQYEPDSMAAPIVVAKGAGLIAQRIRLLALEHGIPLVEKKPLAQALYREVDVNRPIPQEKYAAVAEVLAYVYQLKGKKIPAPPGQAA
ncbi:MAG: flagellar biosynthetic protein FlhB [Planctomycetes bacterium RBG_16_64_12]|nr:MAG: flagellar biosynthetic protein FlhB [Planctomycetes bacterium RBG_16_64_12]